MRSTVRFSKKQRAILKDRNAVPSKEFHSRVADREDAVRVKAADEEFMKLKKGEDEDEAKKGEDEKGEDEAKASPPC